MWTVNILGHEVYKVTHIEFSLLKVNSSYCAWTKLQLRTKVHEFFHSATIGKKKIFTSEIKHSKHQPPPPCLYIAPTRSS